MMNYDEFKDTVLNEIKSVLPAEYKDCTVKVEKVVKNNGTTYDALIIDTYQDSPEIKKVVPNIYLNKFYEDYTNGIHTLDQTLKDIAAARVHCEVPLADRASILSDIEDFNKIKDQIQVRLVNYDKNVDYLKDKPHTKFLDMAEVYYLEVGSFGDGKGSVVITDKMLGYWSMDNTVDAEVLHKQAMDNIAAQQYYQIESMEDVIRAMMGGEIPDDMAGITNPDVPSTYVVSTKDKMWGASAMLDTNLMEKVAEKCQGDFFIIPSSVHELLAVPQTGQTYEEMEYMIRDVNRSVVDNAEILSDRCYMFDAKLSRVVFADEKLNQEQEVTNDKVQQFPLSEELPFDQSANMRQHRGGR